MYIHASIRIYVYLSIFIHIYLPPIKPNFKDCLPNTSATSDIIIFLLVPYFTYIYQFICIFMYKCVDLYV
jgi:hypothetical protein